MTLFTNYTLVICNFLLFVTKSIYHPLIYDFEERTFEQVQNVGSKFREKNHKKQLLFYNPSS